MKGLPLASGCPSYLLRVGTGRGSNVGAEDVRDPHCGLLSAGSSKVPKMASSNAVPATEGVFFKDQRPPCPVPEIELL